jgi:hypothetical protein
MAAKNQFLDDSGVLQRQMVLDENNGIVILEADDDELMDVENHGADGDHSYAGRDALPALGIRASQLKLATGSSTGTGAQQTIAHGLAVAPTVVLITPTEALASAAENPFMSAAADITNIYITTGSGINYNWMAIV